MKLKRVRGQSEAIAAQRLESRVLPEVDLRSRQLIKDANNRLQTDLKNRHAEGRRSSGRCPRSFQSAYLRLSAEIAGPDELAGDVTNPQEKRRRTGVAHARIAANNAIKHLNFAGKTMNDAEIHSELESYLTLLAGRPIKIGDKGRQRRPRTRRASSCSIKKTRSGSRSRTANHLVIRAGFKQEGKEDIPTQVITVPLQLSVKGNHVWSIGERCNRLCGI